MKHVIYIKDTNQEGNVAIKLQYILEKMDKVGHKFTWSILDLEAVGDLHNEYSYDEIDSVISEKNGYWITWNNLKNLSNKFEQVINLLIVGSKEVKPISNHNFEKLIKDFPLVIRILDGDYWEIYSDDDFLINLLNKNFDNTEIRNIDVS